MTTICTVRSAESFLFISNIAISDLHLHIHCYCRRGTLVLFLSFRYSEFLDLHGNDISSMSLLNFQNDSCMRCAVVSSWVSVKKSESCIFKQFQKYLNRFIKNNKKILAKFFTLNFPRSNILYIFLFLLCLTFILIIFLTSQLGKGRVMLVC